jgi:hypothetical protein
MRPINAPEGRRHNHAQSHCAYCILQSNQCEGGVTSALVTIWSLFLQSLTTEKQSDQLHQCLLGRLHECGCSNDAQDARSFAASDQAWQNPDRSHQSDHVVFHPLTQKWTKGSPFDEIHFAAQNVLKSKLHTSLINYAELFVCLVRHVKRQIDIRIGARVSSCLRPKKIQCRQSCRPQLRRGSINYLADLCWFHTLYIPSESSKST